MSREQREEGTLYSLYALARETCQERLRENPDLDRTQLLVRAGEYYVDLVKKSQSLEDLLQARDYFYQAGEFERAAYIVVAACEYLLRWGHLDRLMKLLKESADTTQGHCLGKPGHHLSEYGKLSSGPGKVHPGTEYV
ncbi:MAG: hypothetical protein HZA01_15525 [Nitrospinae bacterium]|nr:hypothetical protein [Nitrospinota bacterium]